MKKIILLLLSCLLINSCTDQPITVPTEPLVFISNPINNSNIPDTTTIKINAFDLVGLKRVELFIDNQIAKVFEKPPYEMFWETRHHPDGSQHLLEARAFDSDGNKVLSKPVIINVFRFMPSGLNAAVISDSVVRLTWSDNSRRETGFIIEMSLDDSLYTKVAETDSNITSYNLTYSFNFDESYYFRVKAKSKEGFSGYSNQAKANFVFFPPADLNVEFMADTAVSVNWKDNNAFEKFYKIALFNNYNSIPINTIYVDKDVESAVLKANLEDNYSYRVEVSAMRGNLFSSVSTKVKQFIFLEPEITFVEPAGEGGMIIKWKNNNAYNTEYKVYRSYSNSNFVSIKQVSEQQITVFPTDTAKNYYYAVSAVSKYNESYYSTPARIAYSPSLNKIGEFKLNYIYNYKMTFDNSKILLSGRSGKLLTLSVFDPSARQIIKTFSRSLDSTGMVYEDYSLSYDEKYIAAVSYLDHITLWDYTDLSLIKIIKTASPGSITFNPTKNILYYSQGNRITALNLTSNLVDFQITLNNSLYGLICSSDGNYLATRSGNNVYVINLKTNTLMPGSVTIYAGLPRFLNNTTLLVPGGNKITYWDIPLNSSETIPLSVTSIHKTAPSPNNKLLLLVGEDEDVFFDAENRKENNSSNLPLRDAEFLTDYIVIEQILDQFNYYSVHKSWMRARIP